jgi:hypothetical protein
MGSEQHAAHHVFCCTLHSSHRQKWISRFLVGASERDRPDGLTYGRWDCGRELQKIDWDLSSVEDESRLEEHDTLFDEDLEEKGICFLALIFRHRKTNGVCGGQALAKGQAFAEAWLRLSVVERGQLLSLCHGMRPVSTRSPYKN